MKKKKKGKFGCKKGEVLGLAVYLVAVSVMTLMVLYPRENRVDFNEKYEKAGIEWYERDYMKP